jgi:peptidoglycan/LPS O-acetylase OafA/YrhL
LLIQEHESSGSKFEFKPQLSGLRFCAVLFVVVYHFSGFLLSLRFTYDLGAFIVFFFVLSSYLITRILLDAKQKALIEGRSVWKIAVAFLTRRTFRIFPAYYLYLFILLLFPLQGRDLREHPGYYFGYLYNFWIYKSSSEGPYAFHLWTLAVEEQFYIIWPWIILFIPTRHLTKVFTTMILVAVAFRVIFITVAFQPDLFRILVQTPGCLDSFGAGALLAYLHYSGKENNQWLKWVSLLAFPFWVLLILTSDRHLRVFYGLDRVFISLFTVLVIDVANRGYTGITKKFLENSIVQWLSKISYGIYLYHLITTLFFWKLFEFLQPRLGKYGYDLSFVGKWIASPYVSFWVYFLMAVACATISWYCLEKPFNNFRKLFYYVKPKLKKGIRSKPS